MVSPFVVETLFSHAPDSRAYPLDEPIGSQGTRNAKALAIPPMMQITLAGGDYYRCRDLDQPTAAMAARGNVQALVTPAFLADFYGRGREASRLDDPARPCTTRIHQGVVVPPAFLANYYGGGGQERRVTPLDGAQCTVSVENRSGVVVPPAFLANYYTGGGEVTPIDKAQGTVATVDRSGLVESGDAIEAEDCYFRMLQPHEIGAAMAFPEAYVVLGNKREMVKQYGNAVTPPAMEFLIQRCVESLAA
jgi:DNA (cytosine-5)-methyltransferase 1